MKLSVQRSLDSCPIDPLIPSIVAALRTSRNVVIEAAPGAGKTTRVPPALLEFGPVLVLEPRRIAARLAARRVAFELGERPGETVGYQVRFEESSSARTRLRFLTEGVLVRRMLSDPGLNDTAVVVLDEFHERHLESDLALGLLRRLQKTTRPDLRIVVMSATLEAAPVAQFLGDCPVIRSEGRLHELAISHLPYSAAPLEEQVAASLPRLKTRGDVLVFLPGAAEIRRALNACSRFDGDVMPLHGDLTAAEQDRAVTRGPRRKLILATNIAESSITIDGVTAVVDSGLARIASDSPWTGIPRLQVSRISKASAKQRAGRAGRQGPGEAVRLYTAEDFHRRADHDTPEILRREISQLYLQLQVMGIGELEWFEAPPDAAVSAARELLARLGVEPAMARLPLHPRLARLVLEDNSEDGCAAAALLSSGARTESTDLMRELDKPLQGATLATFEQIRRIVKPRRKQSERRLELAILRAFPDRVMKRAENPKEFLVAVDIEERSDKDGPIVRLACGIEPEWLIDVFPERIRERDGVEWNRAAERVDAVSALLYDDLVIQESRGGVPDPEAAARMLIEMGAAKVIDREGLDAFTARVAFAAEHSSIGPVKDEDIDEALREICFGARRISEVKGASLLEPIARKIDRRLLDEIAPDKLRLPSGRQTKVHYEPEKPPWVASRLQDFFGMRESPRVAKGKVPLTLHLLAPSQRPVQTTTDLAGFWERLYPQLRKELGRRYPRHSWPESPV
jgi:ATP-dependent helicase HrpB